MKITYELDPEKDKFLTPVYSQAEEYHRYLFRLEERIRKYIAPPEEHEEYELNKEDQKLNDRQMLDSIHKGICEEIELFYDDIPDNWAYMQHHLIKDKLDEIKSLKSEIKNLKGQIDTKKTL